MIKVAIEVMAFALAAFSLQFIMGVGGLVSFGHAAYFGIGAYAAGLLVTGPLKAPMELALVLAPVVAGAGAALFGFFVVRLSGIYLAMLTAGLRADRLFGLLPVGRGHGRRQRGRGRVALGVGELRAVYFYVVAALSLLAIAALRHVIYAPFGYTLRAARDSATRADAIGIDVRTHRWLGFTLAGARRAWRARSTPSPRAPSTRP
jgi:branched-chain amino acid transport system permease protein